MNADLTSFSEGACIAGGLLPQCQNCAKSGCQMCSHCIPAMPTDADAICTVCNVAQWDDADPVEQGWVTPHGCTLVSWASDQKVSVYHCKCSDRQDSAAILIC